MEQALIEELAADRDWRFSELEFVKKVPKFYTNDLFEASIDKYWRICVPIIYAHWEGFVVFSYRQLVSYINNKNLKYSQVKQYIVLLSNKRRFGYLQGNQSEAQRKRFLDEYSQEEREGINMPLDVVSAKSNLNFKTYKSILEEFDISITQTHVSNEMSIEKLVTYRNKIAHGENSVFVIENDINKLIDCVMEMIDLTIADINSYVNSRHFMV